MLDWEPGLALTSYQMQGGASLHLDAQDALDGACGAEELAAGPGEFLFVDGNTHDVPP